MIAMKASAAAVFVLLLAVGCGGAPAPEVNNPPPAPSEARPEAPVKRTPGPSVSQELGEIDPRAVESTFTRLRSSLASCHHAGINRVEYLSGEVKFFLRIGADGKAKWGNIEHSTLRDRETEKCMLNTMISAAWPTPKGGEAEVRKDLVFDLGDARAPYNWHAERAALAIPKIREAAQKCGKSSGFDITAYVAPEGSSGKTEAAGISGGGKEGEAAADCIVDAVKSAKWPSPGSYTAKITFKL